jgi:hypothetical protein
VTAELGENDHLAVKKQRPSGNHNSAKAPQAKLEVDSAVQSWTPHEDYLDFKRASRRNRKQRLTAARLL